MPSVTAALETVGLEKRFDQLPVTRQLSLRIEAGAHHALIGPNGAGKTTVINLLTGVLRPDAGRIMLEGFDITGLPVHARVRRGLSRTFQVNQLYPDLTPWETIGLAVSERMRHGGDWWRRLGTRADVCDEIAEILTRFHLLDVMNELTAELPYGKQRLLRRAIRSRSPTASENRRFLGNRSGADGVHVPHLRDQPDRDDHPEPAGVQESADT